MAYLSFSRYDVCPTAAYLLGGNSLPWCLGAYEDDGIVWEKSSRLFAADMGDVDLVCKGESGGQAKPKPILMGSLAPFTIERDCTDDSKVRQTSSALSNVQHYDECCTAEKRRRPENSQLSFGDE